MSPSITISSGNGWPRKSASEAYRTLRTAEREALSTACQAWDDLPMTLRFAASSAERGRSRHTLSGNAFSRLGDLEARCAGILADHGYQPG
jgi:hypothetical protein